MAISKRLSLKRRLRYRKAVAKRAEQLRERANRWQYEQNTLALVGLMTILWAGMERYLDEFINWHMALTHITENCEHPRALNRKLNYLKRRVENDFGFSDAEKETVRSLRLEIKRLSEFRHDLAHGIFVRRDRSKLVWSAQRLNIRRNKMTPQNREYSNDEIQQGVKDVDKLSRGVRQMAERYVPHLSTTRSAISS
ncbi:hypothetical protein [Parasphingopyxis sp.]|uniref:hypothetical protein n=1 Tax=Parasphingopyxis sp. TaxID=1920299 RepID=UPI00263804CD|nr:hypothetical protein [Parasphingopyxis sp.]